MRVLVFLTQETAESGKAVKFPKHIKHRGRVLATIYGKSKSYPLYRVAWTVTGKRLMRAFNRYGDAKRHAEGLVKDLAKGSQATALTAGQARDALAAFDRLQGYYTATGRRVSLLAAVSEFCEVSAKVHGQTLGEAVEGYLRTIASVKRKDVSEAVEEFIANAEALTRASEGQQVQVSPKYHYNRSIMLRRFAGTFPGNAVPDLAKDLAKKHLDTFVQTALADFSAESRNHHRAAIRQFLQWCVRNGWGYPLEYGWRRGLTV